jgi:hypothetical protein
MSGGAALYHCRMCHHRPPTYPERWRWQHARPPEVCRARVNSEGRCRVVTRVGDAAPQPNSGVLMPALQSQDAWITSQVHRAFFWDGSPRHAARQTLLRHSLEESAVCRKWCNERRPGSTLPYFFSRFNCRFSFSVFCGFFLSFCFFTSLPLLMNCLLRESRRLSSCTVHRAGHWWTPPGTFSPIGMHAACLGRGDYPSCMPNGFSAAGPRRGHGTRTLQSVSSGNGQSDQTIRPSPGRS